MREERQKMERIQPDEEKKQKMEQGRTRETGLIRCPWCLSSERMTRYHDEEWGVPLHDDQKQFEFLTMEVMQCGLNWNMMMQKREVFRECFDGFDYERVAQYGETEIAGILTAEGMIRSRRKVEAVIGNAKSFLRIREEFGSFSAYLWSFSEGKTILYAGHQKGELPAKNELSERISGELKRRGFRYLGPVTVYSHLQACGIINDHREDCFRYSELIGGYPAVRKHRRGEA